MGGSGGRSIDDDPGSVDVPDLSRGSRDLEDVIDDE